MQERFMFSFHFFLNWAVWLLCLFLAENVLVKIFFYSTWCCLLLICLTYSPQCFTTSYIACKLTGSAASFLFPLLWVQMLGGTSGLKGCHCLAISAVRSQPLICGLSGYTITNANLIVWEDSWLSYWHILCQQFHASKECFPSLDSILIYSFIHAGLKPALVPYAGLRLTIFLPLVSKCWGCRQM